MGGHCAGVVQWGSASYCVRLAFVQPVCQKATVLMRVPEDEGYEEWHQSVRDLHLQLDSENVDMGWMSSMMQCVDDIARISGWTLKPSCCQNRGGMGTRSDPVMAWRPFIASLQEVLNALDSLHTYSPDSTGSKVHLIAPGTSFTRSSTLMRDGLVVSRRKSLFRGRRAYQSLKDQRIAGNVGLGLKGTHEQTLLPPSVVREEAFLNAFSRSARTKEPRGRGDFVCKE